LLGNAASKSGSLAMLAAIRLASSPVSSFAADLRPGSFLEIDVGERLAVVIAHDEAGVQFLNGPRRREAVGRAFVARNCFHCCRNVIGRLAEQS
jgi:hypothetical protein